MCKATQEVQTREPTVNDNEPRFLRSAKLHRAIPFKESAVRVKIARKRQPNRRSKKNLDDLYEMLAPGSVVQKTNQYTSVIREPRCISSQYRFCKVRNPGRTQDQAARIHQQTRPRSSKSLLMLKS